jgi:sarcosine oxidase
MQRFDVAVVGLGAVGSAALYQLSKTGLNVIGIDKYAPPHSFGSSGGESRVTRQVLAEGEFYMPMVRRANDIWKELEDLSGMELYNHCGLLLAGYEQHIFIQKTLSLARESSVEHRLLTGKEVEQLFPAINAFDSGHAYYYEPASGFLRPEKCIEVQLSAARDNNATALSGFSVEEIQETSGAVKLSLNNGEVIEAEKVIVASGSWIKTMLADVLASKLKTYLQTMYWFDIEPGHYNELIIGKMPIFLCGDDKTATTRSFYNFPAISGPKGGMKFAVHESDLEIEPDTKDVARPVTSAEEVYDFASKYIKYIRPNIIKSLNCLYTMTPDENFILDFLPGSTRMIIASACSGHGFKYSAATGEVAVQLAMNKDTSFDISSFSLDRF